MKASTPIVDAVKRQHAEDDARALKSAQGVLRHAEGMLSRQNLEKAK